MSCRNPAITVLCILAIVTVTIPARGQEAQGTPEPPCTQPEASQFDFWLGEWDLEWGEDGVGRNVITKSLDGCVIVEDFDGTPSIPLRGMSVSSFDARRSGAWQQTWVDNRGGYLDFTGGFADGRMVLQRRAVHMGKNVLQRMVWYDIERDSLRWNWERSVDDGETWETLWEIHYTRRR